MYQLIIELFCIFFFFLENIVICKMRRSRLIKKKKKKECKKHYVYSFLTPCYPHPPIRTLIVTVNSEIRWPDRIRRYPSASEPLSWFVMEIDSDGVGDKRMCLDDPGKSIINDRAIAIVSFSSVKRTRTLTLKW